MTINKNVDPLIYNNSQEKGYLFFADVAHMHEINTEYGHEAGDEALRCAAQSLSAILGDKIAIGHYYDVHSEYFTDGITKEQAQKAR